MLWRLILDRILESERPIERVFWAALIVNDELKLILAPCPVIQRCGSHICLGVYPEFVFILSLTVTHISPATDPIVF